MGYESKVIFKAVDKILELSERLGESVAQARDHIAEIANVEEVVPLEKQEQEK